ncbi:MAG: glycosyltransferase family 39 protein, partial [Spirochaetes bacterium]|nr:glycosyltransferase family 39 protein [Spirochaetota bacterium]
EKYGKYKFFLLLFIIIIAFLLRANQADWGFPLLTHPDEPSIANHPYKMIVNNTLDPQNYHKGCQVSIYINSILFDLASRLYFKKSLVQTFPENMTFFYYIARIVMAIFGTLSVLVVFLIGKEHSANLGLFSAFLFALFPSYVNHSHYATADISLTFFILLVVLYAIRYLKNPSNLNFIVMCICSGLATVEKYPGLLTSLLIAFVVFFQNKQGFKVLFTKLCYAFVLFILFVFLFSPFLFIKYYYVIGSVVSEARPFHAGVEPLSYTGTLLFYLKAYMSFSSVFLIFFMIMGLAGVILKKIKYLIPVFFGIIYCLFLSKLSLHWERWALPMYITPIFLTAFGFLFVYEWIIKREKHFKYPFMLLFFAVVFTIFLNYLTININRLDRLAIPDIRVTALQYLEENNITKDNSHYSTYTPFAPQRDGQKIIQIYQDREEFYDKEYVILSSSSYGFTLKNEETYPEEVKIYREIFQLPLVKEFIPEKLPAFPSSKIDFVNIYHNIKQMNYYRKNLSHIQRGPIIKIYKIHK